MRETFQNSFKHTDASVFVTGSAGICHQQDERISRQVRSNRCIIRLSDIASTDAFRRLFFVSRKPRIDRRGLFCRSLYTGFTYCIIGNCTDGIAMVIDFLSILSYITVRIIILEEGETKLC